MTRDEVETLFDTETINRRVAELGADLGRDYGQPPMVLALAGGSVVFLADLVRTIEGPVVFDFIQVNYSIGSQDDIMEIHYPISLSVEGRELLILKDVSSTGVIETYLTTQFSARGAADVQFASLIDVPEDRRTAFNPRYALFTSERNGPFVGFGLKHHGRYGNLPYIGCLPSR